MPRIGNPLFIWLKKGFFRPWVDIFDFGIPMCKAMWVGCPRFCWTNGCLPCNGGEKGNHEWTKHQIRGVSTIQIFKYPSPPAHQPSQTPLRLWNLPNGNIQLNNFYKSVSIICILKVSESILVSIDDLDLIWFRGQRSTDFRWNRRKPTTEIK